MSDVPTQIPASSIEEVDDNESLRSFRSGESTPREANGKPSLNERLKNVGERLAAFAIGSQPPTFNPSVPPPQPSFIPGLGLPGHVGRVGCGTVPQLTKLEDLDIFVRVLGHEFIVLFNNSNNSIYVTRKEKGEDLDLFMKKLPGQYSEVRGSLERSSLMVTKLERANCRIRDLEDQLAGYERRISAARSSAKTFRDRLRGMEERVTAIKRRNDTLNTDIRSYEKLIKLFKRA